MYYTIFYKNNFTRLLLLGKSGAKKKVILSFVHGAVHYF